MAQESPLLPPQSPPLSPITILLQAGTNDVDAPVPSDVSEGLRDDARGRGDEEERRSDGSGQSEAIAWEEFLSDTTDVEPVVRPPYAAEGGVEAGAAVVGGQYGANRIGEMNNAGVVSEGCDTSANCFRMIKETIYSRNAGQPSALCLCEHCPFSRMCPCFNGQTISFDFDCLKTVGFGNPFSTKIKQGPILFGIDAKGLVKKWSDEAVKITSFTSQEVVGRDLVQEFIPEEHRRSVRAVLDDYALRGRETANFVFALYTKDKRRVDVLLKNTTRSGVVGMIADHEVSDKQACEEHCQSKMHKIFEAVATTGGVGSSLSPKTLTGIDGNLQKLEKALIVEFHYNCLIVETADSAALAANIQQSLHKTGWTRQLIKKEQEKAAARQSLDASQQPAAMIGLQEVTAPVTSDIDRHEDNVDSMHAREESESASGTVDGGAAVGGALDARPSVRTSINVRLTQAPPQPASPAPTTSTASTSSASGRVVPLTPQILHHLLSVPPEVLNIISINLTPEFIAYLEEVARAEGARQSGATSSPGKSIMRSGSVGAEATRWVQRTHEKNRHELLKEVLARLSVELEQAGSSSLRSQAQPQAIPNTNAMSDKLDPLVEELLDVCHSSMEDLHVWAEVDQLMNALSLSHPCPREKCVVFPLVKVTVWQGGKRLAASSVNFDLQFRLYEVDEGKIIKVVLTNLSKGHKIDVWPVYMDQKGEVMVDGRPFDSISLEPGDQKDVPKPGFLGLKKERGEEEEAWALKDKSETTVLKLRFVLKKT